MSHYESFDECQTRLNGTVILYKGEPVVVQQVEANGAEPCLLHLKFLPRSRDSATVLVTDEDLEYRRFNLGYVNLAGGATYAARWPIVEGYKQGLTCNNLKFTSIGGGQPAPNFQHIYVQPGFKDMLQGKYPTAEEAMERLLAQNEPPISVAFQPDFAIRRDQFRGDFLLDYRGQKVGFGKNKFSVPQDYWYLREVLQKSGIPLQ
jgi:hypothetical protein